MSKTSRPSKEALTSQPSLRCFVAMAFGNEDTDTLYDQHIVKAVEAADMLPIRIDKLIHMDRIDARIRSEIAKADVVIADLTYARQSVYWEAGYAERESPVVYTCRRDHFHPVENDPHGNYRVHFDLANANIIPWSGTGSAAFRAKLHKTLLYASKSVRQQKAEQRQDALQRKQFTLRAPLEQRRSITDASLRCLRSLGFRRPPNSISMYLGLKILPFIYTVAVVYKQVREDLIVVAVMPCQDSLTHQILHRLDARLYGFWDYRYGLSEENANLVRMLTHRRIRAVRRIMLLPILGSVPSTRIARVLSDWRRLDSFLHYMYRNVREPAVVSNNKAGIEHHEPTTLEILIVDNIKSMPEYEVQLKHTFSEVENERAPIEEDR